MKINNQSIALSNYAETYSKTLEEVAEAIKSEQKTIME